MNNDLFLLIVGAGIGFISTISVELIRRLLDKRRQIKEREYEEGHLRELNLRKFIETEESMKSVPLAWLKLFETTHSPGYLRSSSTTESLPTLIRMLSRSTKPKRADGHYRVIEKVILGKTQLIGRQDDCEISLDDISVSRQHAMIRYDGEQYIIYDLGSTTETLVNNQSVPKEGRALLHGDRITLGKSKFEFESTFLENLGQREEESQKRKRADVTIAERGLKVKKRKP